MYSQNKGEKEGKNSVNKGIYTCSHPVHTLFTTPFAIDNTVVIDSRQQLSLELFTPRVFPRTTKGILSWLSLTQEATGGVWKACQLPWVPADMTDNSFNSLQAPLSVTTVLPSPPTCD